jgi:beta-galactosidase
VPLRAALAVLAALLLAPPAAAAAPDPVAPFPRDFLWGVATSGFQSEMGGRPSNADTGTDWWRWARDAENVREGRVSGDRPERGPGFLNAWRGDVDRAAGELHLRAFRTGVEWSRIFPRSTRGATTLRELDRLADRAAVRRYRAILRRVRDRGMRPFVTLSHFTLPLWVHDPIAARAALAGADPHGALPTWDAPRGWLDRATVSEFAKFARYAAWRFGDLVDDWTPLNEPLVVATNGYVNVPGAFAGWFPPGAFSFTAAITAIEHQGLANATAYDALKARDRRDRVGLVVNMIAFTPATAEPADARAAQRADLLFNRSFAELAVNGWYDTDADGARDPGEVRPRLARKADFLGVNYYFRSRVRALPEALSPRIPLLDWLPGQEYRRAGRPDAAPCPTTCSDFGWELYPEGLRRVLGTAGRYRLPVVITEGGLADAGDRLRQRYLPAQLRVLRRAMRDRVADVRGWFHWSLTDNFEWAEGDEMRFGLYRYDPVTLRRTARPSARLYGRIARTGRVPAGR